MEPRHEEKKDQEPRPEAKEARPRRFRIVKLEERIAPSAGGNGTNHGCALTACQCVGSCKPHQC
jgi:hypothetical protein